MKQEYFHSGLSYTKGYFKQYQLYPAGNWQCKFKRLRRTLKSNEWRTYFCPPHSSKPIEWKADLKPFTIYNCLSHVTHFTQHHFKNWYCGKQEKAVCLGPNELWDWLVAAVAVGDRVGCALIGRLVVRFPPPPVRMSMCPWARYLTPNCSQWLC